MEHRPGLPTTSPPRTHAPPPRNSSYHPPTAPTRTHPTAPARAPTRPFPAERGYGTSPLRRPPALVDVVR
eukprot:971212-Pyramimonas_sp.AAC.1